MLMPIMNKIFYFFICFLILSCDFQKQTNSTGRQLEIILVQSENCSKEDFEVFKENLIIQQTPLLETEIYGEIKNLFYVISISEKDFSSIFRTHKNIIFVNSGNNFSIQYKENVWAKNQNVYLCSINTKEGGSNQIINLSKSVSEKIKTKEIKKRVDKYSKTTPQNIQKYLAEKHNLSISLPVNFFIVDSLNGVLNLRGDTKNSSQRILISPFSLDSKIKNIISHQNEIAKNNISSEIQGSFVSIEERTNLYIDSLKTANQEKINIKGLWTMEGDFMGGSFFTTLVTNLKKNQKHIISLYLYAPGENKAHYLLDLESILESVKYINN